MRLLRVPVRTLLDGPHLRLHDQPQMRSPSWPREDDSRIKMTKSPQQAPLERPCWGQAGPWPRNFRPQRHPIWRRKGTRWSRQRGVCLRAAVGRHQQAILERPCWGQTVPWPRDFRPRLNFLLLSNETSHRWAGQAAARAMPRQMLALWIDMHLLDLLAEADLHRRLDLRLWVPSRRPHWHRHRFHR